MHDHWLNPAFRTLLNREGVGICAGLIADFDAPLYPIETTLLQDCVPTRVSEFTAGRAAARHAMQALGLPPLAIPVSPSRAPLWPRGLIGSITHDPDHCASVVTRSGTLVGIGIDIEQIRPMSDEMIVLFASLAEQGAWKDRHGACRDHLATVLFSAKESTFKAVNPLRGTLRNPKEFEVFLDVDKQTFRAFEVPSSRDIGVEGRWQTHEGCVLTAATLLAPAPARATKLIRPDRGLLEPA